MRLGEKDITGTIKMTDLPAALPDGWGFYENRTRKEKKILARRRWLVRTTVSLKSSKSKGYLKVGHFVCPWFFNDLRERCPPEIATGLGDFE